MSLSDSCSTINNNSVRISATDEVRHEKAAEEAYTLEAKLFANEVSIEGAEADIISGIRKQSSPERIQINPTISSSTTVEDINKRGNVIEQQITEEDEEDEDFFDDDEEEDLDEGDEIDEESDEHVEGEEDPYDNDLLKRTTTSRRSSKWIHTPTSPKNALREGTLTPLTLQKINATIRRFPKVPKSIPHQSEAKPHSQAIRSGTNSALEWASGLWSK